VFFENENDEDYNSEFLDKLLNDFEYPRGLCSMISNKLKE
jgi:hypothetical protein